MWIRCMEYEFKEFFKYIFGLEEGIRIILTCDFVSIFDQECHVIYISPANETTSEVIDNKFVFI